MAPRYARPSIPEVLNAEMAEPLENLGASEELLQLWAGHEDRLFEQTGKQSFTLSAQWRQAVGALAAQLTRHMIRPWSCVLGAIQLFDASCSRMVEAGTVPEIHRVFTWVAAACLINSKISEESSPYPLKVDTLARIASDHSSHFGGRQIEPDDIQLAEAVLARQTNWLFQTTTVETWVNAYATRFHLVTGCRLLQPFLGALEAVCTRWTSLLTLRISYSSTNTPRMSACGIFGLALLALRILPVEALIPAESIQEKNKKQAAGWATQVEQIIEFTQSQMDTEQLALHSDRLPVQAVGVVIEFATLCNKLDVQEHMKAVVRTLLGAFEVPLPRGAAAAGLQTCGI